MIKKLYSAKKDKKDKKISDEQRNVKDKDAVRLEKTISEREVFSYKYSRLWCLLNFSSSCFCCCRVRNRRRDFLYKDAKRKLADETDLLEIIKKIRIFKFASDCTLKPRQRDLVNFFDEYRLKSDDN